MARPRKPPDSGDEALFPMVVTSAAILIGSERYGQDARIAVPAHVRATLLQAMTARDA